MSGQTPEPITQTLRTALEAQPGITPVPDGFEDSLAPAIAVPDVSEATVSETTRNSLVSAFKIELGPARSRSRTRLPVPSPYSPPVRTPAMLPSALSARKDG